MDVLRGLADAHEQSIYHRDVSPHNIIVRDDGQAVLIDFGLASKADAAQSAVGSPPYTAPEVWTRRTWSPAADIYSAAAAVLQAMLGRLPYAGAGHRRAPHARPADGRAAGPLRAGPARRRSSAASPTTPPTGRPTLAAFAEEVLRASDIVPVARRPPGREPDGRRRCAGSTGTAASATPATGVSTTPSPARPTWRPAWTAELLPAIVRGELDVVVLSGNPGDGKTSFLVNVGAELDRQGAIVLAEDPAGWRRSLGGRTFAAVYDASESHGELTLRRLDPAGVRGRRCAHGAAGRERRPDRPVLRRPRRSLPRGRRRAGTAARSARRPRRTPGSCSST